MKNDKKSAFDYGNFLIEYRPSRDGVLRFLRKKITDVDVALTEASKLKDSGNHDVLIKKVK